MQNEEGAKSATEAYMNIRRGADERLTKLCAKMRLGVNKALGLG